ncbi:TetR/AcrR family transcriptional regulator [uncultured Alsobacter sp.]|uniref:TetR/AcrR family transcriptional regulator n=1 Tax=uncultured Alsobacter sp. TaxID=1748258 RepID=UPI0025FBAB1F|nr:TetR/AcrR family transcriptional regulator [uncultured Alsobacter sp.]
MDAARRLLGERGAAGFSLADAAKIAGVSPAAPYRHFKDRDALLAEVAAEGFALFGQRLGEAMRSASDPVASFRAMGSAYLSFAREQPGLYTAMFSWCATPDDMESSPARDAFAMLIDGIAKALGGGNRTPEETRNLAVQVWALSHGLAMLAGSGQLGREVDTEALLMAGTGRLLGLPPGAGKL